MTQREIDKDKDAYEAAVYSTLTRLDGTVIAPYGVTLPDGTEITRDEDFARLNSQAAADVAFEETIFSCHGKTLRATFSAGVASYPAHGTTAEKLLSAGDHALYAAKAAG